MQLAEVKVKVSWMKTKLIHFCGSVELDLLDLILIQYCAK